jgi:regulator of protease activity HflC (stomatin/prohibitin superfamily)
MADEVEEGAPDGALGLPPPADWHGPRDPEALGSPQPPEAAQPSIEWALALEMVRYAGATCRARMAAAQEVVSQVRRWAVAQAREAENAKRRAADAEARAAAAEARAGEADARARRAEARLEAEAQKPASSGRADEMSQRMPRFYESAYRGSRAAGTVIDRRARRAFTANR